MVTYLTAAGNALMNSVIGDEAVLNFTKIQFGNGTDWETQDDSSLRSQIASATALYNVIKEIEFDDQDGDEVTIDPVSGLALLKSHFQNLSDTTGWHVTEVGIWAQQGDDTESEVLYAVSADDVSKSAWIPPSNDQVLTFNHSVYVYIGDVANVTAAIAIEADKASKQDLDDHIQKRNNPHVVTKEQVELGNVPNVTTNDQRPYYTEATTLANIDGSSQTNPQTNVLEGVETLSTIFGKIKKAIAEFILHKDNTSNPHKVTAAQVGAAAVQHYHNGQDINAGMVKPEHGGTASVYDKSTALSNSSDCAVVLWTEESGNGLYKCGGYVNCDSRKVWVQFPKEFKDTRYTVTFDTSGGGGLIPMWKKPEKYTNGFYMVRTLGIDSTPLKDALKRVFFFSDSIKEAIDDGIGASHAADWTAIGQAK